LNIFYKLTSYFTEVIIIVKHRSFSVKTINGHVEKKMHIDLRTLTLLLSVTNILQVIILYIHYKINKAYNGLNYWLAGFAVIAVGSLMLLMRDISSIRNYTIVLSNFLLILGIIFVYIGCMRFFNRKTSLVPLLTLNIIGHAVIGYYTFFNDDISSRIVFFSLVAAIVALTGSYGVFKHAPRSILSSSKFLSLLLFIYGIFYGFRCMVTIIYPNTVHFFDPSLLQVMTLFSSYLEAIVLPFALITMVNHRIRIEYQEASEHIATIFDTSPDAILVSNYKDGRIININKSFTTLTGYTSEDCLGKTTTELSIWSDPKDRDTFVKALTAENPVFNHEAILFRKDKTHLIGLISAKIITIQGKRFIISVTKDITERKEAELKALGNEQKNTALAMAVTANHEIKQPLSVIKGAFGLITGKLNLEDVATQKHIATVNTALAEIETILAKMRDLENTENIIFKSYIGNNTMININKKQ